LIDKKTIFVLGAGASCPYGYPSGAQLRKQICLDFEDKYSRYLYAREKAAVGEIWDLYEEHEVKDFTSKFFKSSIKSIDLFLARNPSLAPIGKYIIAFEIFDAESKSHFREQAVKEQDWYSYLFNRLTDGLTTGDHLPDFSNGNIGFITFNYDRSLEHFLYESMRNSFTQASEEMILQCLKGLRIIHVYGKIAPLDWEGGDYAKYVPKRIYEGLLRKAARNIRTIYEGEESPQLAEAHELLKSEERIFSLGFGYAPENMEVMDLPDLIPESCRVYGTAYGLETKEISDIRDRIVKGLKPGGRTDSNIRRVNIDNFDCLKLLRDYL
jgi:hypothetical protein